ncbi:hypothetical protein AB2B41_23155 [Marimonas sp. MJW-29]|uniref:Uncharacterized protein n=1 Tax=Sulfitobacter sediminis TaxID=3234186 RepID=A0ABV3RU22_9RHOB
MKRFLQANMRLSAPGNRSVIPEDRSWPWKAFETIEVKDKKVRI